MKTIQMTTHIGHDGILHLDMPVGLQDQSAETVVVLQSNHKDANSSDSRGWPPGFFEKTYGCLAGNPMERAPQGELEKREDII
ncbi:MAG: hypothetical protein NTX50_12970 [Candidatus Sumerlaeota bacterium]|nr:hypothetical protein [Candidatus Sumerlaeota bacterium]